MVLAEEALWNMKLYPRIGSVFFGGDDHLTVRQFYMQPVRSHIIGGAPWRAARGKRIELVNLRADLD